jgi:DNA anti-recombination protein RmuC
MADVTKTVKDAAYVTVGLGVLAFQRAQVGRRELTKQVETQLKQVETQLSGTGEQVQRLASQLEQRIKPVLDQLEESVPATAKDLVKQARTAAREVQGQVLGRTNGTKPTTKKKAA